MADLVDLHACNPWRRLEDDTLWYLARYGRFMWPWLSARDEHLAAMELHHRHLPVPDRLYAPSWEPPRPSA